MHKQAGKTSICLFFQQILTEHSCVCPGTVLGTGHMETSDFIPVPRKLPAWWGRLPIRIQALAEERHGHSLEDNKDGFLSRRK